MSSATMLVLLVVPEVRRSSTTWPSCRWHHRRVHEGGWRMELCEHGETRFYRPDGRLLPEVPPRPEVGADPAGDLEREGRHLGIGERTPTTRWLGDPLDVDWARFTPGGRPRRSTGVGPGRLRGDVCRRERVRGQGQGAIGP